MSSDRPERVAELVGFALECLRAMQLEDGTFCHEVVRGDPTPRGRSLRYTLMALVGLLRADAAGLEHRLDLGRIKRAALAELDAPELTAGDLGLALWADARSGAEAVQRLLEGLERELAKGALEALEGMEVAWIAIGLRALGGEARGPGGERLLQAVLDQLLDARASTSGLLAHRGRGARRRFPNFATQIYGLLALVYAAGSGDSRALEAARRLGDRVVALQRPDGGWPWLFDARRGTVVEPFEVYSVHQDGMAPMALLELTELTGDERYRDAAVRGLDWIWGQNELGRPMLDREAGMLYRSIRRRAPLDRAVLYANTLGSCLGRPPLAGLHRGLEVYATDRPYHLGWVLEAWAGRERAASSSAVASSSS